MAVLLFFFRETVQNIHTSVVFSSRTLPSSSASYRLNSNKLSQSVQMLLLLSQWELFGFVLSALLISYNFITGRQPEIKVTGPIHAVHHYFLPWLLSSALLSPLFLQRFHIHSPTGRTMKNIPPCPIFLAQKYFPALVFCFCFSSTSVQPIRGLFKAQFECAMHG